MLCRQPARVTARESDFVIPVGLVRARRKLVRAGDQDLAHEVAQVEPVGRQAVQQLRICGRIGRAKIVRRIHDAPAHQLPPDAVHGGACKVRIRRRRKPLGQTRAAVFSRPELDPAPAQEFRAHRLLAVRMFELQFRIDVQIALIVPRPPFELYLREERRQAQKVVPFPVFARVVVAARAFQADAEKYLARESRHVFGFLLDRIEICRQRLVRASARRQQFAGEPVKGHVAGKRVAQPRLEVRGAVVEELRGVGQEIPQLHRPEIGILRPLQQIFHQPRALVGRAVREETLHFVRARQRPG